MRRRPGFAFPLLLIVLASVLLVLSSCAPRCYDREFRGGGVVRVCR